jgi:hypothetical protein
MRPNSLLALLVILALSAPASRAQFIVEPMDNDDCGTAKTLVAGDNPSDWFNHWFTNIGATPSTFPAPSSCGGTSADVWFKYTPPANVTVTASTCLVLGQTGAIDDTIVSVYFWVPAMGDCTNAIPWACNDDNCQSQRSRVTFSASAGVTYFVRVAGAAGATGIFQIDLDVLLVAGDDCNAPIGLIYGTNGPFTNDLATGGVTPGAVPCVNNSAIGQDMWFSITATTCGPMVVDACGTSDTVIEVWSSCMGPRLACNDDGGGPCSPGSHASFVTTIGSTYLIRVGTPSFQGAVSFTLTVSAGAGAAAFSVYAPTGPGTLKIDVGGPPNGTYFLAVTLTPGDYPDGWLFGLDIPYADLVGQYGLGFPFTGTLGPCGTFTLGPFQGLSPSLDLYGVVLTFPAGSPLPAAHSPAAAHTPP